MSGIAIPIRSIAQRIGARWLNGPNARAVKNAVGLVLDSSLALEGYGLQAGLPQICNEDCLPYLGRDRVIYRGPNEPANLYAPRLTTARDSHRGRAGVYQLLIELWNYWSPTFRTVTFVQDNSIWYSIDPSGVITRTDNSASPNWKWDARAGGAGGAANPKWWRFWIIVDGSPWSQWTYGDGHHFGDYDLVYGTTAPGTFIQGIRQIIKTWKEQGTSCDRIIFKYDDSLFLPANAPGPNMPGGDWDVPSNRATSATYLQGVA